MLKYFTKNALLLFVISILLVSCKTQKLNLKKLSFLNNNNHSIYPGSIIYVPRNVEFRDEVEFLSLISPVFSSLAVSIASLSAISND